MGGTDITELTGILVKNDTIYGCDAVDCGITNGTLAIRRPRHDHLN